MKSFRPSVWFVAALVMAQLSFASITVMRAPGGGIQPQAVVDGFGTVHLIYFKGNERAGDVFYVRRKVDEKDFSKPLHVNSRPSSAMAVGSIRGAQLAIGKNSRVHVIWNGAEGSEKAKVEGEEITPLVYARMNDAGTGFEAERNLITFAGGLDGGSSIAADPVGNVYAAWHGRAPGSPEGEHGRAIFVARSMDDGKTFLRETPAIKEQTGACGCCGMKAFAHSNGTVYILYRAASDKLNRDQILLAGRPGEPFQIVHRHPWVVNACPMSSAFISPARAGVTAAWETQGQVFFATVQGSTMGKINSPSGPAKRKHPVTATNARGETLVAWTEGTAWAKGGSVGWQIFNKDGDPAGDSGRGDGLPVWGLVTAYADAKGDFVVIY